MRWRRDKSETSPGAPDLPDVLERFRTASLATLAQRFVTGDADRLLAAQAGEQVLAGAGFTVVVGGTDEPHAEGEPLPDPHQVGCRNDEDGIHVAFVEAYVSDDEPDPVVLITDDDERLDQGTRPYLLTLLAHDPRWQQVLRDDAALADAVAAGTVTYSYLSVRVTGAGEVLVTPYLLD